MGTMFHEFISTSYDYKEISLYKDVNFIGKTYRINGTFDGYNKDEKKLIENKTALYFPKGDKPFKKHIHQALSYYSLILHADNLKDSETNVEIPKDELIINNIEIKYADLSRLYPLKVDPVDIFDDIIVYCNVVTSYIIKTELLNNKNELVLPLNKEKSFCKYCNYEKYCELI